MWVRHTTWTMQERCFDAAHCFQSRLMKRFFLCSGLNLIPVKSTTVRGGIARVMHGYEVVLIWFLFHK